jgi:hypothetical protein
LERPDRTTDRSAKWLRIVYMLVFALLYNVAEFVMLATALLQIATTLFAGGPNQHARRLGQQLAVYAYDCWRFLTYNSEHKPFPFSDWPSAIESAGTERDSGR